MFRPLLQNRLPTALELSQVIEEEQALRTFPLTRKDVYTFTTQPIQAERKQLEEKKQANEKEENQFWISKETLKKCDDFIDPLFYLLLNVHRVIKLIFPRIKEYTNKIATFISLTVGGLLNVFGLYNLIYREKTVGQRNTKIADSIINLIATGIYLFTTYVVKFSILTNITWLITLASGLGKDSYCTHRARITVADEKSDIQRLIIEFRRLKEEEKKNTLRLEEKIALIHLPIQIKYHIQHLKKLRRDRFENKRAVLFSVFNTILGILSLGGSLLAPLFFIMASKSSLKWLAHQATTAQIVITIFNLLDLLCDSKLTSWITDNILVPIRNCIKSCFCGNVESTQTVMLRELEGKDTAGITAILSRESGVTATYTPVPARSPTVVGSPYRTASSPTAAHSHPVPSPRPRLGSTSIPITA